MLETEIKALTAAVIALTERLDAMSVQAPAPATPSPAKAPEPAAPAPAMPTHDDIPDFDEPVKADAPAEVTKDSLQAWALKMVRDDKSFKAKLMSALSDHGVKTISQLPDNSAAASVLAALGGSL